MQPYWSSADGSIVVYHAPYEDVLAAGLVPVDEILLIHDDPPYGQNEATDRGTRGRAGAMSRTANAGTCVPRNFPKIVGDDKPFDPTVVLALSRPTVIWGGHLCVPPLPPSPSILIWDKREGQTPDDNGDCELAWSNLGGPMRVFRHFWRGALRKTEKVERHVHPTQKPIALCSWVYQRAKLKRGDLIFVPHGGSGPDLPAAQAMGLRLIWCEVEKLYCDTAIARLGAITPDRCAEPPGPLFAGVT